MFGHLVYTWTYRLGLRKQDEQSTSQTNLKKSLQRWLCFYIMSLVAHKINTRFKYHVPRNGSWHMASEKIS